MSEQKFEALSTQNDSMRTRHCFWNLAVRMKTKHLMMLMPDEDVGDKDAEVVAEWDSLCFQNYL
jgi:hypothetical protein